MSDPNPNPYFKNEDLPLAWLMPVIDVSRVIIAGDTWTDDDILCFGVEFLDENGMNRRIGMWWAGEDSYAAAKYANDCEKAKTDFLAEINRTLEGLRGE